MNLVGVRYYNGEAPFIDRFKTAGVWASNFSNGTVANSALDANGNPIWQTGTTSMQVMVGIDPVAASPIDTYVLMYSGTATIQVVGGTIISSQPGQITFSVTSSNGNGVPIKITSTDPADPVRDFHVVRQDQMALYQSGETFNPDFVAKASNWSVLRFMDWGNTNSNMAPVTWANRSHETDATWSSKGTGVPLETMVKLANEAHTDMWINIPTVADDSYVTGALTYIRDHLDPTLKVNVEYSNEVWNWSFAQTNYARNQANALWGKDVNGDGTINPNDPAEAVLAGELVYYGYRSAQIAAIGNSVFGTDPRLQMVVAQQAGATSAYKYIFDGASRANAGSVSSLFDELAITTYFGNTLMGGNTTDQATILGWARSGSAGVDAAFNYLANGGTLSQDSSIKALANSLADTYAIAQNYGLDMVAYEGGAHLTADRYAAADQPTMVAFIGALMNDPRMGDLYKSMADTFYAAGGTTMVAFDDVGNNSKYGYWGVLDDIYQTSSARYDALLQEAQNGLTAKSATTSISTRLSNFTLADAGVNLTYTGTQSFTGTGNSYDNTIIGGATVTNKLCGGAGNDTLTGGTLADTLDGGTGADTMIGGAGNDIYYVDDAGDVVVENLNEGTDLVNTSLGQYTPGANVENVTYIGTGNFIGTGNALNNVITGGAGDDVLNGGLGADRMVGGLGNDTYYVDNAGDSVAEAATAGTDTIYTTLNSYYMPGNVEILRFTGTGNFSTGGNGLDNTIYGGAGDDRIDGGLGNDVMVGSKGNDTYIVDSTTDQIVENASEGYDKVYASASFTLSANVEDLTLTGSALNGTGNASNNILTGNNMGNIIDGGAGDDTINGGAGNDVVMGGAGNDIMNGGTENDVLIGGAGKDMLTGGLGADTFRFNAGDLATTIANSDTVVDFNRSQLDKIDFSAIDANLLTKTTNEAFTFIDSRAFTKHAGELRSVWNTSGYWEVSGDLNGDGVADMALRVNGVKATPLIASDFIL